MRLQHGQNGRHVPRLSTARSMPPQQVRRLQEQGKRKTSILDSGTLLEKLFQRLQILFDRPSVF